MVCSFHRMAIHLAVLGALALAPPAFAEDLDHSFDQGTTALKAGKYEDALRAFEAVWKERKTHDIAANLALAEAQLGRHRDAAEHFAFALRTFPVTGSEVVRKSIADAFAQSKTHVGTLSVTVSADGAEVRVDGHPVGRSPIAEDIFVDPGPHTIEARLTGYAIASQRLDAKAASAGTVKLTLTPLVAPTSAVTAPPPPRSPIPAFVLGGVGVASLVAGGALFGLHKAGEADIRDRMPRDEKGDPLCQRPPASGAVSAVCSDLESKTKEANAFGNAGVSLFAVGGAAAAGALLYMLWPAPKRDSAAPAAALVPAVSADGAGFFWTGSF